MQFYSSTNTNTSTRKVLFQNRNIPIVFLGNKTEYKIHDMCLNTFKNTLAITVCKLIAIMSKMFNYQR